MPWQTPKTDWQSTDCFEISDYNRIKQNALFLAERLREIRGTAPALTLYDADEAYIPTADFYTNTEKAAADIRNAVTSANAPCGVYDAYDAVWDYNDIIRLEDMQQKSLTLLCAEKDALRPLAFTLSKEGHFEP